MLSNHVLCETVENTLFPKAKEIQAIASDLVHKQFACNWPGPQGFTGNNELDYTIQLLDGAINLLLQVAKAQQVRVTRYMDLSLKEDYVSMDGKHWKIATSEEVHNPSRNRFLLKQDGTLRVAPGYRPDPCPTAPVIQKAMGSSDREAVENTSTEGERPFWPECISKLFRKGDRHE